MITIIAGSRTYNDFHTLLKAIENCPWKITKVISGRARGVDQMGERWADYKDLPCDKYKAEWDKYGKRAGYLRNEVMADQAEALIALWDYQSKGTRNMIDIARRKGLEVFVWKITKPKTITTYKQPIGL